MEAASEALQPAGISAVLVYPAPAHPWSPVRAGDRPGPLRMVPIQIQGSGLTDRPLPSLEPPDNLFSDPAASADVQALALRPGANLSVAIR
jgi:hypothetical protein